MQIVRVHHLDLSPKFSAELACSSGLYYCTQRLLEEREKEKKSSLIDHSVFDAGKKSPQSIRLNVVEEDQESMRKYGGLWGRYFGFGLSAHLYVADPEVLREIFIEKANVFSETILGSTMPDK